MPPGTIHICIFEERLQFWQKSPCKNMLFSDTFPFRPQLRKYAFPPGPRRKQTTQFQLLTFTSSPIRIGTRHKKTSLCITKKKSFSASTLENVLKYLWNACVQKGACSEVTYPCIHQVWQNISGTKLDAWLKRLWTKGDSRCERGQNARSN